MSGVDANFGWQAILFIAGALVIWDRIAGISARNKSQRRDVAIIEGAATQAEVNAVKKDCQDRIHSVASEVKGIATDVREGLETLGLQMRESETRILDKDEQRSVALHQRLNDFEGKLGEVRGEMKTIQRRGAHDAGI